MHSATAIRSASASSSILDYHSRTGFTLVHELAHAHGLTDRDHGRAECEVIVEATTAVVLGSLGFDPSGFSVPYIAGWAQDEAGLDALERFAATIDETARKIETALGLER